MDRVILHSDLNNYFASVECLLDPSLVGKPIAVCGSVENRHGIVLAKSEQAKRMGVKTAEAVWQAQQKCPNLIIVRPHHDEYVKYSRKMREIYYSYTDQVEPFGIDEAWLDVTGSRRLFGSGLEIAEAIRERAKRECSLTVSVGVSFNKIFAKLGSDYKKPDAVTEFTRENFKEKLWQLPASDMMGVGKATGERLAMFGLTTIGDIANYGEKLMSDILGKCGTQLFAYAIGEDDSPVSTYGYRAPAKSISHGMTLATNLTSSDEVRRVLLELSQSVARKLRESEAAATSVQVSIRDEKLWWSQFQTALAYPTQSYKELAEAGFRLFLERYSWKRDVRAVTIGAIKLRNANAPFQTDMFCDQCGRERQDRLERAVEAVRARYGRESVRIASLMCGLSAPVKRRDCDVELAEAGK